MCSGPFPSGLTLVVNVVETELFLWNKVLTYQNVQPYAVDCDSNAGSDKLHQIPS